MRYSVNFLQSLTMAIPVSNIITKEAEMQGQLRAAAICILKDGSTESL